MKLKRTDTFIENDITVNGVTVGIVELNPDKQEISRLIIYEPYQNKGYGTEVIKELIDKGYTSLWVKSDNERAIHIYEKCGFVKSAKVMYEMKLNIVTDLKGE